MASTRNNNMPGDYKLEQRTNVMINNHNVNKYGKSYHDARPTQNVNYGKMSRDTLSNNAIDIETDLFGIGSTNLVQPQAPVTPSLNSIPYTDFTDARVFVPTPQIYVMNNQRPLMR